ncbi:MAG: ATP-dependent DNA ligase [Planctomycetota bacterium]
MQFAAIVRASAEVAQSPARTRKIEILADTLRAANAAEAGIVTAYLMGELPQGKLGLGYATLRDARASEAAVTPTLDVTDVDAACAALAGVRGRGAHGKRARILRDLLGHMTAPEQDFFFKLALGELRQGALQAVVAEAVAKAANVEPDDLRRAVMLAGELRVVAAAALGEGKAALSRFKLAVLSPVQPMLAQPADDLPSTLAELGQASIEWKLDGARVQVHKSGDSVRVFSRQLNDVTAAVPEVVEAVRALPSQKLVLDGEAIALREDARPRPFQETMRRFGRRIDVDELRAEIPLTCFFFDLLHIDGADLLTQPLVTRASLLQDLVPEGARVPGITTHDLHAAQAFMQRALAAGHEGVMLKDLSAPYEAGRRGASWRKLKPVRTLDLVVLAAEWGSGRRQGHLSNIHLGARDPDGGEFVMLGKTFKGMTDAMLAEQTQAFLQREVGREGNVVYVRPELVVEIAFDGVQRSQRYPGGVALRFARVLRYRPDRSPETADTIGSVQALLRDGHEEDSLEDSDDVS